MAVVKLRGYVNFVRSLPAKIDAKLTMPDKYKDTIVEKWVLYWRSLIGDYKEVWTDTVADAKDRPLKATLIFSALTGCVLLARNNPDELSYRQRLVSAANDLALVPQSTRSRRSAEHLAAAFRVDNAGCTRRLTLGIASFMWSADYSPELGLYSAQCNHLGPRIVTFHNRIIDFGFMGQWWQLEAFMKDYDVSDEEFPESQL